MSDLTLEDLLAEPCENFTGPSYCPDAGDERVPVSDSGTWNEYCGPCRLRYVINSKEATIMSAPEEPAKSPVMYLTLSEFHDLRKYMGALTDLHKAGNLYPGDHFVYASSREPVGKIVFHENEFVFQYDYIEENHREERA